MDQGLDLAREHSKTAQTRYANYYNRRARDKSFSIGKDVLLLAPDSTKSKTFRKWQGPATVVEVLSPYSYIIDLNGVHHWVHADRLRRYWREVEAVSTNLSHLLEIAEPDATREQQFTDFNHNPQKHLSQNSDGQGHENDSVLSVSTCALVMDSDDDFGELVTVETKASVQLPSQLIPSEKLAHLSAEQRSQLLEVLDRYAPVFSEKPGFTDAAVHRIELTPEFRPKRLPEYRIPHRLKPEVDRQISEMLQLGIIKPSSSPMSSPVVCVLKGPNGCNGVRLAVDYRYINSYTVGDNFPIPNIDDLIQEIGQFKFLTLCDAKSGYWQCGVAEGDEWETAFICNSNLYEFTRVPFGMRNAQATFCRAMQKILRHICRVVKSYVDDLILGTSTWKSHLQGLELFLKTIMDNMVTLALRKCLFALPRIKFCGQIVGSGCRSADPEKTRALQDLQRPTNQTELRRALGSFNYFRDSIPNYAEVAPPLTNLLGKKKSKQLDWTGDQENAWQKLKSELIGATNRALAIIDWTKPFNIQCDTSDHTLAGALTQLDQAGTERPIAFFSTKLNPAQRNYAVVEKEALAAITALNKFKGWLFGASQVIIISEHNPLLFLTQASPKSPKLTRWALALQCYPLEWKYRRGQLNYVADCLTRQTADSV